MCILPECNNQGFYNNNFFFRFYYHLPSNIRIQLFTMYIRSYAVVVRALHPLYSPPYSVLPTERKLWAARAFKIFFCATLQISGLIIKLWFNKSACNPCRQALRLNPATHLLYFVKLVKLSARPLADSSIMAAFTCCLLRSPMKNSAFWCRRWRFRRPIEVAIDSKYVRRFSSLNGPRSLPVTGAKMT
jgi:hypothetical protein